MKHVILFISLFITPFIGYTQELETADVDLLLTETMLKEVSIKTKLIHSIDYMTGDFLLLSSRNQFYLLGMGGIDSLFSVSKRTVNAYTVTPDGLLLIVSGKNLCTIDTMGSLVDLYTLPDAEMGISSGIGSVYVFDQHRRGNKQQTYSIYIISRNSQYTKLLTIPTPVASVFEDGTNVFFSTENRLLCADVKTKKLTEIISLPKKEDKIISITRDTLNHAFYFSTDKAIYRIKDNKTECIGNEFGGILRYDGEGLLIFNPETNLIVRLRNNILYNTAQAGASLVEQSAQTVAPTPAFFPVPEINYSFQESL
jgi:hypothetical protein